MGAHVKIGAIVIAGVLVAGVVSAVALVLLHQNETPEPPPIALRLPLQIAHPDPLRRERRHLADRLLERQHVLLTDIQA